MLARNPTARSEIVFVFWKLYARWGRLLTAVALEDGVLRMPLVDPAKRDLVGLVVRFSAFDDSRHSRASSYRLNAAKEGS